MQVAHLIDTYQFMIDHDEIEVGRWSYYDQCLKSAKITKAKMKYPELDKMIVKKIKSAEILRAVDIRDQLPVICSGSAKVLKKFVAGTLKFAEAFEAAEEAGGNNMQLGRLTKFRTWLVKPEVETALARSEGQSRAKIAYELDKIDTRVKALRKKLNHN